MFIVELRELRLKEGLYLCAPIMSHGCETNKGEKPVVMAVVTTAEE